MTLSSEMLSIGTDETQPFLTLYLKHISAALIIFIVMSHDRNRTNGLIAFLSVSKVIAISPDVSSPPPPSETSSTETNTIIKLTTR